MCQQTSGHWVDGADRVNSTSDLVRQTRLEKSKYRAKEAMGLTSLFTFSYALSDHTGQSHDRV